MSLFIPVTIGLTTLAAFMLGGGKKAEAATAKEEVDTLPPTQKTAAVEAAKALKDEDWMRAVSNAIASGSPRFMREVSAELKKAGLKDAAADLLKFADKAAKEAGSKVAPTLKTAPKPPVKATPKPAPKPTPSLKPSAATLAKQKAEAAAKKKAAEEKAKKDAAAKKKAEESAKKKQQATELKDHLKATGRYKENKTYVVAFQKNAKLTADGMYGPNTARAFWAIYKIVPVNPFYWTANTTQRAKDVTAYKAFLDTIKADAPQHASEVDKLYPVVGK